MSEAVDRSRAPFGALAAIYAISIPLAWLVTPAGVSWDTSIAGFAVGLSWLMGLAPWWLAINAVFVPALSFAVTADVSPLWALAAFAALLLVYGGIWKSRVPLFFTSRRALLPLSRLIPDGAARFLDIGCGDARVLTRLAGEHRSCRFEGVEQALVPWLLALARCRLARGDCAVTRADLWKTDLSRYDVVYAYLSPAVMARLWAKARGEMRPGTRLVSAFAVPGVAPAETIEVGDAMGTRLHVWHMGG
jgi:hypothetical protein